MLYLDFQQTLLSRLKEFSKPRKFSPAEWSHQNQWYCTVGTAYFCVKSLLSLRGRQNAAQRAVLGFTIPQPYTHLFATNLCRTSVFAARQPARLARELAERQKRERKAAAEKRAREEAERKAKQAQDVKDAEEEWAAHYRTG